MGNDLESRFLHWCLAKKASEPQAEELWSSLSALYQEPHRRYHNLNHIAASLGELDATGKGTAELEGAIWFHDVIYDPTRSDNEEASMVWFENATAGWMAKQERSAIVRLISVTDFRLPRSDDATEALMVDIDLAILSAEWPAYDAYRRAVRREYAHVPDEVFRVGRARVMASFLEKPVYRTTFFEAREIKTRENISRELDELASVQPLDA